MQDLSRGGPAHPRLHARRRGRGAVPRRRCVPDGPTVAGSGAGHLRRDRRLVRQVDRVPRRGGRGHRRGRALDRPPPWLGGEPAGVGAPRGRPGRPRRRADRHVAPLAAHHRRTAGSRARWSASSATRPPWPHAGTVRWPSASSTAGTARSRPGPTSGAGRPTWPSAAGWPSTTSSPTPPTAGARPTSSTWPRWTRASSSTTAPAAACGCCAECGAPR